MKNKDLSLVRNSDIQNAYFILLNHYRKRGFPKAEAMTRTFDDLELRFDLTRRSLRLIRDLTTKNKLSQQISPVELNWRYKRLKEIADIITNAIEKY